MIKNSSQQDNGDRENGDIPSGVIFGRNSVKEALRSGRPVECLIVERGEHKNSLSPIVSECKKRGIPVKEADTKKLDFMTGHGAHQGVVLVAAAHEYSSVEDILALASERGEKPFIIICDSIEDPHNLGAIIRSAEAAGAHGVIIPKRRSVGLTGIVGKASAGALEYIPVARVTNLVSTIEELKKKDIWVYCADMNGEDYTKTDFSGGAALVVGNEGSGVSRLVRESCDTVVSIPMNGKINSLNASVAAGIIMFRIAQKRK